MVGRPAEADKVVALQDAEAAATAVRVSDEALAAADGARNVTS
jgi:hypothetical protein